jgi:hypothetical protein
LLTAALWALKRVRWEVDAIAHDPLRKWPNVIWANPTWPNVTQSLQKENPWKDFQDISCGRCATESNSNSVFYNFSKVVTAALRMFKPVKWEVDAFAHIPEPNLTIWANPTRPSVAAALQKQPMDGFSRHFVWTSCHCKELEFHTLKFFKLAAALWMLKLVRWVVAAIAHVT